jgi:hypothetical protein
MINIESLEAIVCLFITFIIELFQMELNAKSNIISFNIFSSKDLEIEKFLNEKSEIDNIIIKITQLILKSKFKKYKMKKKIKDTNQIIIEYKIPFLKFEKIDHLKELDKIFFKIAMELNDFEILYKI